MQRRYYALALFACAHAVLGIDRSVVAVVLEPIRHEFHASDTQLGLLSGLAFALCFGIAAIPLGRLSDRTSRIWVLTASLGLFSLMTTLSGMTRTFLQLAAARFVVGAGEAGAQPAIMSMISDLFPPSRRATAISLYYLGLPIGSMLMWAVGAWTAQTYGWRAAFYVAGAPGLLLTALMILTVREPGRGAGDGLPAPPPEPFKVTMAFIASQPALRHVLAAGLIMSTAAAAHGGWMASFMIRSHHLSLAAAGLAMAIGFSAAVALGTLTCGPLIDWVARKDPHWRVWLPMAALLVLFPVMIGLLLAPSTVLMLPMLVLWAFLSGCVFAPMLALCQALVTSRMRGTTVALYHMLGNLIGIGAGGPLVGLISDFLKPQVGQESLKYGMMVAALFYAWGGVHLYFASKTFRRDVARASGQPLEIGVRVAGG